VPVYRDEAVVLRTHKLGEADRIVTMLAKQRGKIRAVAKGVRRTSSKFGARLEPFMLVDVQLYEGRSLDTVTQAVTLAAYAGEIAGDYAAYTAANTIVETAERLADAEPSPQQYLLLVGALRALSRGEHTPGLILDAYLLRAFSVAGWALALDECAVTGEPGPHSAFSVQLGGLVADEVAPPGAARLGEATVALLRALLAGDWHIADAAEPVARAAASGVVAAFVQWHLERGLKSLPHVDRAAGARADRRTEHVQQAVAASPEQEAEEE